MRRERRLRHGRHRCAGRRRESRRDAVQVLVFIFDVQGGQEASTETACSSPPAERAVPRSRRFQRRHSPRRCVRADEGHARGEPRRAQPGVRSPVASASSNRQFQRGGTASQPPAWHCACPRSTVHRPWFWSKPETAHVRHSAPEVDDGIVESVLDAGLSSPRTASRSNVEPWVVNRSQPVLDVVHASMLRFFVSGSRSQLGRRDEVPWPDPTAVAARVECIAAIGELESVAGLPPWSKRRARGSNNVAPAGRHDHACGHLSRCGDVVEQSSRRPRRRLDPGREQQGSGPVSVGGGIACRIERSQDPSRPGRHRRTNSTPTEPVLHEAEARGGGRAWRLYANAASMLSCSRRAKEQMLGLATYWRILSVDDPAAAANHRRGRRAPAQSGTARRRTIASTASAPTLSNSRVAKLRSMSVVDGSRAHRLASRSTTSTRRRLAGTSSACRTDRLPEAGRRRPTWLGPTGRRWSSGNKVVASSHG